MLFSRSDLELRAGCDPESDLGQFSRGSFDHQAVGIGFCATNHKPPGTSLTCRNDLIPTLWFPIWTVDESGTFQFLHGVYEEGAGQRSGSQHCSASMKPSFSWPTGSTSAYAGYPEPRRNFMAGHRLGRLCKDAPVLS